MFVNEISYGTILGGHLTGVVGLMVEVTGEEDTGEEVADILVAVRRHEKAAGKVILLRGEFTPANNIDMGTLVKSLTDAGYFVVIATTGRRYFQWFKNASFLIAETETLEWIGFEVNEIWYILHEDDQPELAIPQTAKLPTLYLVPGPKTSPSGLLSFLKRARFPWAVYLEPKQQLIETVSYGEDL